MGEVWRAEHRLLARDAAIKLVRPEVLGARDENEAQRHAATVRARSAGDRGAELAAHDPGVRLRHHAGRDLLLRDGAAHRPRPRVAGPRVRTAARRIASSTCCARSATRSPTRTRAGSCTATSSRPTSMSCRMGLEYDFAKVLDFGLVKITTRGSRARAETLATRGAHDDRDAQPTWHRRSSSATPTSIGAPTCMRSAASPISC